MEKNQNLNNKNYIEYSTKIFDSINKERPSFILKDLPEFPLSIFRKPKTMNQ